jgi:endonuclease YncB( thermonuclease family)
MKFSKTIALLLPLGILAAPRLAAAEFSAVVAGVHGGDTLTVRNGERSIRIRLSGIDSPEMNQPFGDDARSYAAELALGTTVTVIEEKMDRYGRLVAWVVLADGRNLNHEIVAAGFAWSYRPLSPGNRILRELESDASQKGRGLWAAAEPTPPWEWRKQPPHSMRSARRDTGRSSRARDGRSRRR